MDFLEPLNPLLPDDDQETVLPVVSVIVIIVFIKVFIVARLAGVNVPSNKRLVIALSYIYGIGKKFSSDVCDFVKIDKNKKVSSLTEDEIIKIRECIDKNYVVEGDLRRSVSSNIKRLTDLGCYRGLRHRNKLPVRGQRTHTNARTRKGKAIPIAGKKKAV